MNRTSFAAIVIALAVGSAGNLAHAAGPNDLGGAPSLSSPPSGSLSSSGAGRSVGAAPGTAINGAPSGQSLGAAPGTAIGPSGPSSLSLGAAPGTSIGGRP